MMEPVTAGFHHIEFITRDAARSRVFYTEVLGLRELETVSLPAPEGRLLFSAGSGSPGTLISLVERTGAPRGRPGIGGVHHLALGVAAEVGLLMWKRRLVDGGVQVSGPYDRGYFTSIYFRDPDGQVLEIATAGPGYEIDEPAGALGRELMLPPRRIVRGHRDEAAIARLTHEEPVAEIGPEMALSGIHHISGITDDLDGMGAFLEGVLGLSLIKKTTNRDAPDMPHYFWGRYDGREVGPHSAYTLFGWPESWNRSRAGAGQTQHIAFRATDLNEIERWIERLRTAGIETSEPVNRGFTASARFRAPDGQLMEIATDAPGSRSVAAEKSGV